jgi:hypothetical protein
VFVVADGQSDVQNGIALSEELPARQAIGHQPSVVVTSGVGFSWKAVLERISTA